MKHNKTDCIKLLGWLGLVAFLFAGVYSLWFWMYNPDLTRMRVFLHCWHVSCVGIVGGVVFVMTEKYKRGEW